MALVRNPGASEFLHLRVVRRLVSGGSLIETRTEVPLCLDGPWVTIECSRNSARAAWVDVYLAEDAKLERRVALKVLPSELASSRDRLERFERQANAAAALDPPNIVHVD